MPADREKTKELIRKFRTPYRTAVCGLAMGVLFTSAALFAAEAVTPQAIEEAALSPVLSRFDAGDPPPTAAAVDDADQVIPGIYESEILRLAPDAFTEAEDGADTTAETDDTEDESTPGKYPVTALDLSGSPDKGELLLRNNETDYDPDLYALLEADYPIAAASDPSLPRVLIVHTHGTESYGDGSGSYGDDTPFRTQDTTKNVVAVGSVIADELEARGIRCVHCEVMHDIGDFYGSYDREKESILSYLEKYPSIEYVFDVHRDAIIRGDNEMIAPTVDTPEGRAAQVMLVIGTNAFGADHPGWETNLNVACKLQSAMNADYPLARPINLRGASFNEQFRRGSLLIEVGSSGNTLEEAKLAGKLFARAFADTVEKYEN